MALRKTSLQLDPEVVTKLEGLYPTLTISEIVRLSLEYVLLRGPRVEVQKAQFVEHKREADR